MTRETKLALLLGLGLIILVGIIVSEYVAMQGREESPTPVAHIPDDGVATVAPPSDGSRDRATHAPPPGPDGRRRDANQTRSNDVTTFITNHGLLNHATEERRRSETPHGTPTELRAGDVRPPDDTETRRRDPSPPGETRTHRVANGESLWTIAERYYGRGSDWELIRDANPQHVGRNGSVRDGVVLIIPDRSREDGGVAPGTGGTTTEERRSEPRDTAPPRQRTHTVRQNDTLWSIAQQYLNDGNRYREIVELNRQSIPNPDRLTVGVELRIPQ
ncbi:MAG: LysM peptidoglycan-binding domain-containing protein [Phycisphaeraceae bacterium]|nr:LysM peptidoglycan-binding domain-containing protein [Phycisphaeraceae bacterium]